MSTWLVAAGMGVAIASVAAPAKGVDDGGEPYRTLVFPGGAVSGRETRSGTVVAGWATLPLTDGTMRAECRDGEPSVTFGVKAPPDEALPGGSGSATVAIARRDGKGGGPWDAELTRSGGDAGKLDVSLRKAGAFEAMKAVAGAGRGEPVVIRVDGAPVAVLVGEGRNAAVYERQSSDGTMTEVGTSAPVGVMDDPLAACQDDPAVP